MEKDETRIADMVEIMDSYLKYVPGRYKPTPILLFGDALSCERAHDAQVARCTGATEWSRLTGLVPAIQEWHKRGLLLGDIYHLLYDAKSARDIGTLYGIRNKFRHNNVKEDVMQCFNYANDLMNFTTDAYILGAGLHALQDLQGEDIPIERQFEQTVDFIMDLAFHPPQISTDTCNITDKWCFCETEDDDGEFIKCDSDKCSNGEWFHLGCVKLTPETVPAGKWYCSPECQRSTTTNTTDGKLNYTKSILWHGIGQKVRHDAIREADGTRILSHWRFDMLQFHTNHHPKYFIVGHRLLTDVNGGASERLKHQLLWNRTVNVRGGYSNNLEMDLQMEFQMEFFNKEYKEAIKDAGGHMTDNTIARHSQMVGMKKQLGKVFDNNFAEYKQATSRKVKNERTSDIKALANMLMNAKLFTDLGPRSHHGFPNFQLKQKFTTTDKFISRIEKHQKKRANELKRPAN